MADRPTAGELEQRAAGTLHTDSGRRIRGVIPFGVESIDMGGWREVIEPSAFRATRFDELRATIDHAGVPLGRYPGTLDLEERADGLHWTLDPPQSRGDVVEAISRGDMRAGSWRMIVDGERWEGDVRHVTGISELRDVCIAGAHDPAYPQAAIELRTAELAATTPLTPPPPAPAPAAREPEFATSQNAPPGAGALELRTLGNAPRRAPRSLLDEFRAAGFGRHMPHGTAAVVPYEVMRATEDRALTTSGVALDELNPARRLPPPLQFDERWLFTAVRRIPVGSDVSAVDVITQTARSLATAANVVRTLAAATAKPETGSTITLTSTALNQIATIQTAIPNFYLEQAGFNTVVENDLRLSLYGGLDKLVLDAIAGSGFQAPSTDPLIVSVRKAITTLRAAGFNPDTVVLTPADSAALDVLVSGVSGATADWVGLPAWFTNLRRVESKSIPATAVMDAGAFGSLYTSPVSLARFEADSGTTNTSNVRLELNGLFGTERPAAAVRIAAS